jgi:hypothetical protein
MAGFGDAGCSSSKYGMKRITAMAEIRSEKGNVDLQTADDVESDQSCANLDKARIKATQKLRSCSEL